MKKSYLSPAEITVRIADFIKQECVPLMEEYTYNVGKNTYKMKKPHVFLQYIPPKINKNGIILENDTEDEYPFIIVRFTKQTIKDGRAVTSVELRLGTVGNSLIPDTDSEEKAYKRIKDGGGMIDLLHMSHVIYMEFLKRVELPFSLCKETYKSEARDEWQDPPFFHMSVSFDVDSVMPEPELEKWFEEREGLF